MSSKLSSYAFPVAIGSTLFKNPPDTIPPTDELESLCGELKSLKQKTMERAKKAGEDLKTIEESLKRMKEWEKGKAKAVKREHDSDMDEPRLSVPLHTSPPKTRLGSLPISSLPPSSSRSSVDPRRSFTEDVKKKKKKRKRDFEDSDVEHEPPRPSKASPAPPLHTHTHPHPKVPKAAASTSNSHLKLSGQDFTIPEPFPLLPPRPAVPSPPSPGPSKPTEVMEDFSKAKQPTQVLVNTFYTSIEPWIRGIKEEDIGFLEYTGDEVEPYIVPKLGRHYTEVWEEEDMAIYGGPMPGFSTSRAGGLVSGLQGSSAPTPKWDPSTLMDPDLLTEEKGHGPLTERLMSALLPTLDTSEWKGVKAAEDAMEGRSGGSGAAAARREKMNVSDLEERIRDTMRFHGLLNRAPDYSSKVDDPIATALRHAQQEFRTVVATNKARKERLAAIARDRLGYQEYLDMRDSIDKNISTTFTKLQKKDVPKLGKKKKKSDLNGTVIGAGNVVLPTPCPAALGLGPDEENRLNVSEPLKQLVETRRQWVDTVGGVFEQKQRENPGRIWLFPKQSIYEGIEEDVKREMSMSMLAVPDSDTNRRTNKGKEKARGDEMDVG